MPRLMLDLSVLDCGVVTGVERRALAVARRIEDALGDRWEVVGVAHRSSKLVTGLDVATPIEGLPRAIWRRAVLPLAARRRRVDVLLSFVLHCPDAAGAVCIRTVHEVPPRPGGRRLRLLQRDRPAVCVSEATRADLDSAAPRSSPVRVIHNGVDERFFAVRRAPSATPTALVIGTVRPRRNPTVVAAAAALVAREHPGFRVVWVGAHDGTLVDGVEFTGPLDDAAVVELMSSAAVLIAPSTHEGFGIPVLEALAAGVPVAAADCPAVREVAGEHASLFPAQEPEALARAVVEILGGRTAAEGGRARARDFSWDRCAREHADFVTELHEAAQRRRREARR